MAGVLCFLGFGDTSLTDPSVSILWCQRDKKAWGGTQRDWDSKGFQGLAPVLKPWLSKSIAKYAQLSEWSLGCPRELEDLHQLMK